MPPLRVLYLAAEAEPFVKVGGLADVAGALPRALRGLPAEVTQGSEVDIRLVLPLHPVIKTQTKGLRPLFIFSLPRRGRDLRVSVFEAHLDGMLVYFLEGEPIAAGGSVYSSDATLDGEKYTFFSLAALELPRQLGWTPSIIHANDWHTALVCYALLLERWQGGSSGISSVLTIHNLPFMGPDVSAQLEAYGLALAQTGLPEWARALPLPLGLWAADALVSVSPGYAQEMLSPEFGCGLQDYLHARKDSLSGILNGIDVDSFNPATDPALAANFGVPTLERRSLNKAALQTRLGLPLEPEVPLLGMVTRLDRQKGVDLAPQALRKLADLKWQLVVLGMGDPKLETLLRRFQAEFPERVRLEFKYDAGLARQIYAAADVFLMPSRYEPCGLAQMIAMRYGCIPIASAVGGLKDTILPHKTGFLIERPTAARLSTAIKRALALWADRPLWQALQRNAMSQDFSWSASARQYFALYQRLATQAVAS